MTSNFNLVLLYEFKEKPIRSTEKFIYSLEESISRSENTQIVIPSLVGVRKNGFGLSKKSWQKPV